MEVLESEIEQKIADEDAKIRIAAEELQKEQDKALRRKQERVVKEIGDIKYSLVRYKPFLSTFFVVLANKKNFRIFKKIWRYIPKALRLRERRLCCLK